MPNIAPAGSVSFRPHACVATDLKGAYCDAPPPQQDQVSAGSLREAFEGVSVTPGGLVGPYYSPKRDTGLNLNGDASLGPGEDPIVCRHLSVLWEESFMAPRAAGKPDYRAFSSIEDLRSHTPDDIETIVDIRHRASAEFVGNAAWGRRIADDFKSMEATGQTHRVLQILTPVHAMALGLRIKTCEGSPGYVAKFYDPNLTATHLRAQAGNPEAYAGLTAIDFLRDPAALEDYRMDAQDGQVVFLGEPLADHARQPVRIDHVDSPTLVYLLRLGLADGIARYGEMVEHRQMDPRQVAALLAAKSAWGVPGLHLAMQHDHGDAIRAFGDMLVRADLDSAGIFRLLACKDDERTPGLFPAMQDGKTEAIRAWGDVLARCRLGARDLADLLDARCADGTSGLIAAMRWNEGGSILAYGDILLASGLPATRLVKLMEAKQRNGTPALYAAMERGNVEAIQAFGDVLARSPTDPPQRIQLLAARNLHGTPCLAVALRRNQVEGIRAYGEALAASGLDRQQLSDLLGNSEDAALAMAAILREAHPASRQAYHDVLRTLTP